MNADKLRYLGKEAHWKVFYEEGSASRFVYVSASRLFVYNCMYEVQFYKSRIRGGLFGHELVFEDKEKKEPAAMAVVVNRPAIFVDDLISNVW